MIIDDVPKGEKVFIDSNIFIYHFTGSSEQCSRFLVRCEKRDLIGTTSTNVLLEVMHRLMMIEVLKKKLLSPPNLVKKLQDKPEIIKQLDQYFINTQKIFQMGIIVEPLTNDIIHDSQQYRLKYGLMVNDSTIISIALSNNIKNLATNDLDLTKINGITIFSPTDINP